MRRLSRARFSASIVLLALAAPSIASAQALGNHAQWVTGSGQMCNNVCTASGGRHAVETVSPKNTNRRAYVCRGWVGADWLLPGYNAGPFRDDRADALCFTVAGDGASGVKAAKYDCLCIKM